MLSRRAGPLWRRLLSDPTKTMQKYFCLNLELAAFSEPFNAPQSLIFYSADLVVFRKSENSIGEIWRNSYIWKCATNYCLRKPGQWDAELRAEQGFWLERWFERESVSRIETVSALFVRINLAHGSWPTPFYKRPPKAPMGEGTPSNLRTHSRISGIGARQKRTRETLLRRCQLWG